MTQLFDCEIRVTGVVAPLLCVVASEADAQVIAEREKRWDHNPTPFDQREVTIKLTPRPTL